MFLTPTNHFKTCNTYTTVFSLEYFQKSINLDERPGI